MASQSYPPLAPPKASLMTTLREMFPNVDSCVVEMVVDQFKELEPCINSLLSMSSEQPDLHQVVPTRGPLESPFKKAANVILQQEEEALDVPEISRLSPEAPEFIPTVAPSSTYLDAARSRPSKFEAYEVPPRLRSKLPPSHQSSTEDPLPTDVLGDLEAGGLVMVVLRGLPGSGKSRLARRLLAAAGIGVVLSTDDFFLRNGKYEWKYEDLPKAHAFNQSRAKREVDQRTRLIIIDNTNLVSWELKPYVEMGARNGYRVFLEEPSTPWKFKPSELAKKNKHGVGVHKIRIMLEKYEKGLEIEDLLKRWNLPLHQQRRFSEKNPPPPLGPIGQRMNKPVGKNSINELIAQSMNEPSSQKVNEPIGLSVNEPIQNVSLNDILNDEDIFESESEDELIYEDELADIDYSLDNVHISDTTTFNTVSKDSMDPTNASKNVDDSSEVSTNNFLANLRKYNIKPPIWDRAIGKAEEHIGAIEPNNSDLEVQKYNPELSGWGTIGNTEEQSVASTSSNIDWDNPNNQERLSSSSDVPPYLEPKPQRNLPGIKPIGPLLSPGLGLPLTDVFQPSSDGSNPSDGLFGRGAFSENINNHSSLFSGSAFSNSQVSNSDNQFTGGVLGNDRFNNSNSLFGTGAFNDGKTINSDTLFNYHDSQVNPNESLFVNDVKMNNSDDMFTKGAFSDDKMINSNDTFAGGAFRASKSTSQHEDGIGWKPMEKDVCWEPTEKTATPLEPRNQRRGRSSKNRPPSQRSSSTSTEKSSLSSASATFSPKHENSLESLLTMFPNVPVCELETIHKEHSGDNSKVINYLLDRGESSNAQQDPVLTHQSAPEIGDPAATTVNMQLEPMFAVTLQEMFGPPLDQPFLEMLSPDEILTLPMPINVAMQVFLAWRNALQNTLRSKPDIPSPPEASSPALYPPPAASPALYPPPGFPPARSSSQSRFPVPDYSSSPKTVFAPSAVALYEQQQLNKAMAASLAPAAVKKSESTEPCPGEELTQEQLDEYRKQRNELYKKAQEAHSRKAGGAAGFYARQAREMNEQIKSSQREMQMNWFINSNQDKSNSRLDLHYLPVKDAIENLKEFIGQQQAVANKNVSKNNRNGNVKTVEVITGKGNRNEIGKSKLKPAVINWLTQKNLKFSEINPGSLKVYLKGSKM